MDAFASKIVELTKKFAYISAYRGFFPELQQHKINAPCRFDLVAIDKAKINWLKGIFNQLIQ